MYPEKKIEKFFVLKNLESKHLKNFDKKMKNFKVLPYSTNILRTLKKNKILAFPLYK